jgi:hypothetical protein
MLKKFTHNVLGWAKPETPVESDLFQPTYLCECGVGCCQDSQGNWFHLEKPNKL